ncbi:MAG: TonB-dependent receptor [Pseudomonadota bacterium]
MSMTPMTRFAIFTLLAGTSSTAALAQGTATGDAVFTTEPIVVTAQKREEAITDVPLTVTAYSGETLENIGIDEFDELSAFVPGLNIQEQSANNPGFVIRGITSDSGSAQIAPRVTIYYNGIDVSRSRGSYFDLFDIERIEVVKGPQATLFGTAATIGALSVVTARPTPDLSGALSASYGNYDALEFTGMINGGTEDIAGRLAFVYKERDGYIRNIAGEPGTASEQIVGIDQDDLNGIEQFGIRGSLRIFPTDDSMIDLILTYEQQRNSGTAFTSGSIPPTGGAADPFGFAELGGSPFSESVLGIRDLGLEREVFDASLTFNAPITDSLSLTSITGYRRFDSLETFDADGSALFYLEFAEDAEGEQMSHETRITYDGEMFRGFAGFNIFHEEGTQRVPFSTDEGTYIACAPFGAFAPIQANLSTALGGADPCVAADGTLNAANATAILTGGAATVLPYQSVFENGGKNSSYSVFADATLDLGRFELTAGLRYVYEERQSTYSATQPGSAIFAGLGSPGIPLLGAANTGGSVFSAEDEFDAWLPRFNALYRITDQINIYATVSKGRRAPVIDLSALATAAGVVPDVTLVASERVWNYEGGIKADIDGFFGSVGVFYQDYSNFQTSFFEEGTGQIVPINAGEASNFGVEIEAAYQVIPELRLFANYAYIDAEIDAPAAGGATQFVGSRFRLQPEHSASGGAQFNIDIAEGTEFFLTPTVTYQSEVFFEVPNTQLTSEDGYVLVNLRGGVSFDDGRYEIVGFARNLFDEEYLIDAGNTGGGFGRPTFIAGEPALYGIEVGMRF